MADCANPACAANYACAPEVPTDWVGYFEVYDGPSSGTPACADAFPSQAFSGNRDPAQDPAVCSQCTCGTPSGQTCNVPGEVDVGDATCGNQPTCAAPLPTDWSHPCTVSAQSPYLQGGNNFCGPNANTCSSGNFGPCNVSVSMGALTVTGGACSASLGSTTVPQVSWQAVGLACGGADASSTLGCSGTDVCLPKAAAGFGASLCIMHSGEMACPSVDFTNQHIFYTAASDSRGCTPCSCGGPSGGTCSATVQIYNSTISCTGSAIASLALDTSGGNCANVSANPNIGARKVTTTPVSGGVCAPSGGDPIGSVAGDPNNAVTFCCQ